MINKQFKRTVVQLDHLNIGLMDSLPGLFCIKDKNSNFIFSNQALCKAQGFDSFEKFLNIGANDFNLNCPMVEMANTFVCEDKKVMKEGQPLKILGYYSFSGDQKQLVLGEKKPLFDELGELIGVIGFYQNVTDLNIINTFAMYKKNDLYLNRKKNACYYPIQSWSKFNLSKRQKECLYYLTRGFSVSDIAFVLEISNRTVEDHVNEIKNKMFCCSKKEVIDKAIHYGFLNFLPNLLQTRIF